MSPDNVSDDAPLQAQVSLEKGGRSHGTVELWGCGSDRDDDGVADGTSGPACASLAMQWETLERKLGDAAVALNAGKLLVGADAVDARAVFEAKRAAHYNEFQRIQEMRARQAAGEDEVEEEDTEPARW